MLNDAQRIAVRFNFHKMAPLGIGDEDYRRISMALDLEEADVREYCAACADAAARMADEICPERIPELKGARICFIGDSITSERTSYLRILQRCLQDSPGIEIQDCAVSGWKTSDAIFEFEDRVTSFRPTLIHMMIGTNDARNAYPGEDGSTSSLEGYRRNMRRLIRYGLDLGAQVVLTTIAPAKPAAIPLANGRRPQWETRAFNEVLRGLAAEFPIVLNDVEAALEQQLDAVIDNFDNVHLNATGQRIIAERLLPLLLREINRTQ